MIGYGTATHLNNIEMLWGIELLWVEMGKTVENSQFRRLKDNDKKRLRDVISARENDTCYWSYCVFMFHSRKLHFNWCCTHMPGYYKLDHIQYCWHEDQCKCSWGVLTFSHQSHQGCALFKPFEFIVTDSELREQTWWRTAVWIQTLNGSRIKGLVHNFCLTHTLFQTWMSFFLLLNIKANILKNMGYQTVDFHSIFISCYGS